MSPAKSTAPPAGDSRSEDMKTARFSKVVEAAGAPESYLLLMDPARYTALQKFLKQHRVLTIIQ